MNCFNIPNTYFGYTIHQGPDDRFYGVPEGWDHDDGDPSAVPVMRWLGQRIQAVENTPNTARSE